MWIRKHVRAACHVVLCCVCCTGSPWCLWRPGPEEGDPEDGLLLFMHMFLMESGPGDGTSLPSVPLHEGTTVAGQPLHYEMHFVSPGFPSFKVGARQTAGRVLPHQYCASVTVIG